MLVAGGYNGVVLASAELYDPALGTWSATASMTTTTAETGCGGNGGNQGDRVQSSDRGDHKDFKSTKVESTQFDAAAHTVTITGQGTSAGNPVASTLVTLETGNGLPSWVSLTLSDDRRTPATS